MATNQNPQDTEDQAMAELLALTASRLDAGEAHDVIIRELTAGGWSTAEAVLFVERSNELRKAHAYMLQDNEAAWARYIANELDNGVPSSGLVIAMMDAGFDQDLATSYVQDIVDLTRSRRVRAGIRKVVVGSVLLAIGIGITAFTGGFIITYGLMFWGLWEIMFGVYKMWAD